MSGLTDLWCDGVRLDVTNVALADEAVLSQVSKHASRSGWRGVADCQSAIQQAANLCYATDGGPLETLVHGSTRSEEALVDCRLPIRQFEPPDVGCYGGRCVGFFPIIH
jgi:hypothetical protein